MSHRCQNQDTAHTSDGAAWIAGHSSHMSPFLFLYPEKMQKETSHTFIFYFKSQLDSTLKVRLNLKYGVNQKCLWKHKAKTERGAVAVIWVHPTHGRDTRSQAGGWEGRWAPRNSKMLSSIPDLCTPWGGPGHHLLHRRIWLDGPPHSRAAQLSNQWQSSHSPRMRRKKQTNNIFIISYKLHVQHPSKSTNLSLKMSTKILQNTGQLNTGRHIPCTPVMEYNPKLSDLEQGKFPPVPSLD